MTPKHLCLLLLAIVVVGTKAQLEETQIENDNQFPLPNPEAAAEGIDSGSGDGPIEDPTAVLPSVNQFTTTPSPLEDVQTTTKNEEALDSENAPTSEAIDQPIPDETNDSTRAAEDEVPEIEPNETPQDISISTHVNEVDKDQSCPESCTCHFEGEDFVVDCSQLELTEFPSPIDLRTTILKLHNNKLTEIPKDVSLLTKLKVLNANNNSIMNLALGSVSMLPELRVLKLANNRLIEFPTELRNSFSLMKLEELDLGGNDMRTELKAENFENFQSLNKLTLPNYTIELKEELCASGKKSLKYLCTGPSEVDCIECYALDNVALAGTIAYTGDNIDDNDDSTNIADDVTDDPEISPETTEENSTVKENTTPFSNDTNRARLSTRVEFESNLTDTVSVQQKNETDVNIGATTAETKTGGIDRSVIGMIVAGMVVVVAGITIKKNWSSIRKRFSSTPRPGEHASANGNGAAPEEVPLQNKDKSPV